MFPITDVNLSLNDINKLEELEDLFKAQNEVNSQLKFTIDIKPEKRNFEVVIEKKDEFENISICDMTLNGSQGKAVIIIDDNSHEVINALEELSDTQNERLQNLVMKIGDQYSDKIIYSGGKGSSLALLSKLSKTNGLKFLVPKGLIVTTNSYELLLKQNQKIKEIVDSLQTLSRFSIIF